MKHLIVTLTLLATAGSAQQLLVDTGAASTSSIGGSSLFSAGSTTCSPQPQCGTFFQYLGAQFTLTQATTLSKVEAWMTFGFGGSVTVRIRSVNPAKNGLPGTTSPPFLGPTSIYQQTYTVAGGPTGWVPFDNFNPVLAAGTYWLTFEPVSGTGFNRTMSIGAPSPLEKYAFMHEVSNGFQYLTGKSLGIRIWGTNFDGSAFGTATRSILTINPLYDLIHGGEGEALTRQWIIDLNGHGTTFAKGQLIEGASDSSIKNLNGLSVGAYASTCWSLYASCASAGARGVAYRTFLNNSGAAKTFRINAILKGAFFTGGDAAAFIYAFDPVEFSSTLASSGTGAAEFLLGRDDIGDFNTLDGTLSLATLFPVSSRLTSASAFPPFLHGTLQNIPMQTGFITVQPGAYFTLMFDVIAYSQNGGSANFGDTLVPAENLFTDLSDQPVPEIIAVGPSSTPSKAPQAISLNPVSGSNPVGTPHTVTATVTAAGGSPVEGATVYFHILNGPNTGEPGPAVTDANGQATFTYTSPVNGIDSIQATVGAISSGTVESTWTVPGALHHITIAPLTASIPSGGSQAYAAEGFDQFDNSRGDVTASTVFTITPDGTCVLATCTASVPGPHTVTGTNGPFTATATLNVTSGGSDTLGPIASNVAVSASPLAVNTAASLNATLSDATTGGSNVASASYSINGGAPVAMTLNPTGSVTTQASAPLSAFAEPNIYNVCVQGTDSAGNTGTSSCVSLPVYDRDGAFVTGGGHLTSPPGADLANSSATGRLAFELSSRYVRSSVVPVGEFTVSFSQGSLDFKGTGFDWLVINSQSRAIFRGMGVLNGTVTCKFESEVWDGTLAGKDAFGLKIFDCSTGPSDRFTLPATPIKGGNITIHE